MNTAMHLLSNPLSCFRVSPYNCTASRCFVILFHEGTRKAVEKLALSIQRRVLFIKNHISVNFRTMRDSFKTIKNSFANKQRELRHTLALLRPRILNEMDGLMVRLYKSYTGMKFSSRRHKTAFR